MRICRASLAPYQNLLSQVYPVKIVVDGFDNPIRVDANEAIKLGEELLSAGRRALLLPEPSQAAKDLLFRIYQGS